MKHLVTVGWATAWMGSAWLSGHSLLSLARLEWRSSVERVIVPLALGYGITAYLVFAWGSIGWLNRSVVWTVFGVLLAGGALGWRAAVRGWSRSRDSRAVSPRISTPERLLLLVIAAFAGSTLVAALAPPTEWDTLTYHLAAPAHFLRMGAIDFVPYKEWANPFTAEMWNVIGLTVDSGSLAQVFQWTMGLVGAAAVCLLGHRVSRTVGITAATLYYTSPHIFSLSTSAKSDLAWMAFLLLSLHLTLRWAEGAPMRWLWFSAVFAGLALGTRVQGLWWVPAVTLVVLSIYRVEKRRSWSGSLARAMLFGALAIVVAGPWWTRNLIASGDPFWPYAYSVFPSRFWTQALHDKYAAWSSGPGHSLLDYLAGPWNVTVNQAAWHFGLRGSASPAPLAFSPLAFVAWRASSVAVRRLLVACMAAALIYYSLWFTQFQVLRYLLPTLAILMVPAAAGLEASMRASATRWVAGGLFAATLLWFGGMNIAFSVEAISATLGITSESKYLRDNVGLYDDLQWMNRNLPHNAKVLIFHLKTYYLERDYVRGDRNLWPIGENPEATPEMLLDELRHRGVTHILMGDPTQTDSEHSIMSGLLRALQEEGLLRPVYRNENAVWVESRMLDQQRRIVVEVLEVTQDAGGATA